MYNPFVLVILSQSENLKNIHENTQLSFTTTSNLNYLEQTREYTFTIHSDKIQSLIDYKNYLLNNSEIQFRWIIMGNSTGRQWNTILESGEKK